MSIPDDQKKALVKIYSDITKKTTKDFQDALDNPADVSKMSNLSDLLIALFQNPS